MKRLLKYKWSLVILVLHLAVVLWFAAKLPTDAKVPIHWNIKYEVDGWVGRTAGLVWGIIMNFALFLLIYLLHWYSPWYKKYAERFEKVLPALSATLLFCFAALSIYSLYVAIWPEPSGVNLVAVLVGMLLMLTGNLMPKVPKNFFIGIRTPWSIASDRVWDKTHRLGGLLYVLGGFILFLKGFVLVSNSLFQGVTTVIFIILLLYPALHSFILFKLENREKI